MTAAGGISTCMTGTLSPSDSPSQSQAMPYRHGGAPLSPSQKRPQEKTEENRKRQGKRPALPHPPRYPRPAAGIAPPPHLIDHYRKDGEDRLPHHNEGD